MKVVFKVMNEDTLKRQRQNEEEVLNKGQVYRINSEVRPMADPLDPVNGEEGSRKDKERGRRRKERRGKQREGVMRREKEKEAGEVKERRSELRREEPLAKPSLTGAASPPSAPLLFLIFIITTVSLLTHILSPTTV